MPHVGIHGLGAGHAQKHAAQDGEARDAVVKKEFDAVARVDRRQHARRPDNADRTEHRDANEPDEHQRTERAADRGGAEALHHKQQHQHDGGDRHCVGGEIAARDFEALHRAEHRDRRRDHAVAIEQRRADQPADDEIAIASAPARARQRHQRQNAALAVIVGAHHHETVFDRNDNDERPDDQRETAQRAGRVQAAALGLRNGLKYVERAGADIAVNDTERSDQRKGFEPVGALGPALLWVT